MTLGTFDLSSFTTNIESGVNDNKIIADRAWRDSVTLDLSAGNAAPALSVAELIMLFRLSGVATAGRSVTYPALQKVFQVYLPPSATDPVDIVKGSTTISHAVGLLQWYYSGAGANDLFAVALGGSSGVATTNSDHIGVVATIDSAQVVTGNTDTVLDFPNTVYQRGGLFHENTTANPPSRLLIPDGVTKIRPFYNLRFSGGLFGEEIEAWITLNGGTDPGFHLTTRESNHEPSIASSVAPIAVTSGDYIEISTRINRGGSYTASAGSTFGFDVLDGEMYEGRYRAVPSDFEIRLVSGTPAINTVIAKRVFTRAAQFPGNFAGSVGAVLTAPSGTTTLDIRKNGSNIGTMVVDTAGAVSFTTTAGAAQTVVAGDRLDLRTQGSVNGIAGISATLNGIGT